MEKRITIETIKNADWEIRNNVTDDNYGNDYLVYKAYVATIDGHEVKFEHTDERGDEMYIDSKKVEMDSVFEDDEDYNQYSTNVMEMVGEMLDDRYDDLDEIRTRFLYESGEYVDSFTQTDHYGNEVFSIEVHSYEHPDRGTVYTACKDNDPQDPDVEIEYIDDYDYENVLEYHKESIKKHVEEHVHDVIEDLSKDKKFIGTDEQVQAIIDEEVKGEVKEYVGEYSLSYYYDDSEDDRKCEEAHAVYMEGSDIDDRIEALFEEEDED